MRGTYYSKADIAKKDQVVVCEGYTDVIGFHRAGIPRAVATCGTALTEEHVRLLKRYASKVVLSFDADAAGQGAAERFYEWEEKHKVEVLVARLPAGKDPGDLASSQPEALVAAVDKPVPFLKFRLDRTMRGRPKDSPEHRVRLAEDAMAVVNEVATQFDADRVSLGLQRDDQLKLCAISRTAWFDGKSELVLTIENAMEEAIDQQASVIYPVPAGSAGVSIVVAHRDLAVASGAATLMTIPLNTNNGEPVGALTLERDEGPLFSESDLPVGDLIGELLGPEFAARGELERWVAGRLVHVVHDWRDRLLGPRWPGVKLGVAAAVMALLFLAFAEGDFTVSARTLMERHL